MQRFNKENKKVWEQIIVGGILLAAILFAFHNFTKDNNERIIAQNESYIEDVTIQTAKRVDDMLRARQNSLDVIAVTVESTFTNVRWNIFSSVCLCQRCIHWNHKSYSCQLAVRKTRTRDFELGRG